MSTWPYKTADDLREAGYRFKATAKCRGVRCQQTIEWWLTPQNNFMPLDVETLEPHWGQCANATGFFKDKK